MKRIGGEHFETYINRRIVVVKISYDDEVHRRANVHESVQVLEMEREVGFLKIK